MDVAIVFLPLLGAILAGLFGRSLGDRNAQLVTCSMLVVSAVLSVIVFFDVCFGGNARTTELFTWIASGTFELSWALRVDSLTAVMFCVVTIVSSVVHIYSIGYMSEDKSIPRFMSYLSLFTFFMLMLVSAVSGTTDRAPMPRRSRPSWSTASATSVSRSASPGSSCCSARSSSTRSSTRRPASRI
jgi:NADH-quinone oxidoreductase subunit L